MVKKNNMDNKYEQGFSYKEMFLELTKDFKIVFILVGMGIILSFLSPYFLQTPNLRNSLLQSSTIGIVAIVQGLTLTAGKFDLSIGQNVAVTGIVAAYLMKVIGVNPWISIIAALILGALIGLANGVLVSYMGIPAFLTTLGMQNVCRGFAKIITNATPIPTLPQEIAILGRGYFFGIPVSVIIMLSLYVIFVLISGKTKLGRYIYAIGGNSKAAFFSGISVKKYCCIVFIISGTLAAVSGIVLISRLNSASVTNGNLYEFDAIIACIIGGISLSGGSGKIIQALFGSIFLILFFNGMTMLNVDPFYQDVLKGVILIASIGVDVIRNKKRMLG